jgi:predicted nucleic acid-binding protein
VRFWDSSAIVPLLSHETKTGSAIALCSSDPEMIVWWGTPVECASAIARLQRAGGLALAAAAEASRRLDALREAWIEVEPREEVRETARRFLRVHALRSADAFQMAAAFVAAEHRPGTLALVTLDDQLREAAFREGFRIDGL